jgi:hypothetical protein
LWILGLDSPFWWSSSGGAPWKGVSYLLMEMGGNYPHTLVFRYRFILFLFVFPTHLTGKNARALSSIATRRSC